MIVKLSYALDVMIECIISCMWIRVRMDRSYHCLFAYGTFYLVYLFLDESLLPFGRKLSSLDIEKM